MVRVPLGLPAEQSDGTENDTGSVLTQWWGAHRKDTREKRSGEEERGADVASLRR